MFQRRLGILLSSLAGLLWIMLLTDPVARIIIVLLTAHVVWEQTRGAIRATESACLMFYRAILRDPSAYQEYQTTFHQASTTHQPDRGPESSQ
jgi:hypothetical protein